jgi:phosphoenolpyruvate carboxykinase (GTP)
MVPAPGALNTDGLEISADQVAELLRVDPEEWKVELPAMHQHFARFGDHLPTQLHAQLEDLERRLG